MRYKTVHKIKETASPVCSFCGKEVTKVFKGNGTRTICMECMQSATKIMQTAIKRPDESQRTD